MDKVLIDTDVIMDFFFDRKHFAEYSAEVLNLCADKKIQGFTTPVILQMFTTFLEKQQNTLLL